MPRWGQASRRAKGWPERSRPMTKGISSSVALLRWLRWTRSAGKARYQKPVSMSESGAWRCGESRSGMEEGSMADSWWWIEPNMLAFAELFSGLRETRRNSNGVCRPLSPADLGAEEHFHRLFSGLVAGRF